MKIKVDGTKCSGYGLCEKVCPSVFKLDELGFPELMNGGEVPAEYHDDAQKAVDLCPQHAIGWAE